MNKTKLMKLGLAFLSAATLAACSSGGQTLTESSDSAQTETADSEATASFQTASGEELDQILADNDSKEGYLVIDTRPADEYESGKTVQFAINIPSDELEDNMDLIESYSGEKDYVLIGNTQADVEDDAQKLVDAGLEKVFVAPGLEEYDYETATSVGYVTAPKLQEMAESGDYYVLDVRDPKDYEAGHLPNAVNIPLEDFEAGASSEVPSDKPVVVYCYSGNKSNTAAKILGDENGQENVYNATDGTKEYDNFELVTE